ncbi:peptidoglycan-recognition protein LF-like [Microplitis mediator]|uniref:peptidoglycan-recognition protein LF-like n=1 Tax=Microplitis mediator TaxID=375433 RepID=UPI0025566092|nr:peptidoglycan-recognition protein LF-like [Microplitis mediator]
MSTFTKNISYVFYSVILMVVIIEINCTVIRWPREKVKLFATVDDGFIEDVTFVNRSEWKALPATEPLDKLDVIPAPYVMIYHTGTETCFYLKACAPILQGLQAEHMMSYPEDGDIGFNFLISGDGSVYVGRGWDTVGAHTSQLNRKSIGIALIGSFYETSPSAHQISAVINLIDIGMFLGSIDYDFRYRSEPQMPLFIKSEYQLVHIRYFIFYSEWSLIIEITMHICSSSLLITLLIALTRGELNATIFPEGDNSNLTFVSRHEWGAQPPEGPSERLSIIPVPYVIISHTASESCFTQADCIQRVRLIQTMHIEGNGWDDIAYNFLIGGDGRVYVGRGWDAVGAHSFGFNRKSIGVSFIGTFNKETPTEQQIYALENFLNFGMKTNNIDLDYKLLGHRQVSETLSPGDTLFGIIKAMDHWSEQP